MCQFICVYYTCGHRRYIFQEFCESFMMTGRRCASLPDNVKKADIVQKVYETFHCGTCALQITFSNSGATV